MNNNELNLCLNSYQSNIPPRSISYYYAAGGGA